MPPATPQDPSRRRAARSRHSRQARAKPRPDSGFHPTTGNAGSSPRPMKNLPAGISRSLSPMEFVTAFSRLAGGTFDADPRFAFSTAPPPFSSLSAPGGTNLTRIGFRPRNLRGRRQTRSSSRNDPLASWRLPSNRLPPSPGSAPADASRATRGPSRSSGRSRPTMVPRTGGRRSATRTGSHPGYRRRTEGRSIPGRRWPARGPWRGPSPGPCRSASTRRRRRRSFAPGRSP